MDMVRQYAVTLGRQAAEHVKQSQLVQLALGSTALNTLLAASWISLMHGLLAFAIGGIANAAAYYLITRNQPTK